MNYAEQLKHPHWQRRRLEVLNSAGFTCVRCGNADRQLHAHHKVYIRGRMAWDYPDTLLECLCDACHDKAHEQKDRLDLVVAKHPTSELPVLARLFDRLGAAMTAEHPQQRISAINSLQDELDAIDDYRRGAGSGD